MRPLRKLDLRHAFRFHPMHMGRIYVTVERAAIRLQSFEHFPDFLQHRLIEARSRLPDVNEPAFLVIESEHDRPKVLAAAFRVGVTADYTIDRLCNLDLEPFAAAAFFVVAGALFRENPLQTFLP